MFFGSTNGTARRNGEDMVTILIVVDFRSAHSLLSLRTWNVGERLRPTDMMSLFACFDAPPHAMWSALLSFGKQRRTRDHDVEERRRSSLPLQNLYVDVAGFSRHRHAPLIFWSTSVFPHVVGVLILTFQARRSFSDILLLLLLIFSTGQLSSTPEPWCATITFWRSYSAHDEIAGMFCESVRKITYVVVGQSLVMAFC